MCARRVWRGEDGLRTCAHCGYVNHNDIYSLGVRGWFCRIKHPHVSSASKRKRGPTIGRGLMKAGSYGKKIKIEVDPAIGRPKERVEYAKFSSQVGVVARDVLPVVRKWKEIDVQNALDPCIDHMQIHSDIVNMDKPGVRQCVIDRLKNSSRQQRYRLHVHYKKFGNVREAKRNKPTSVNDQQQWKIFCDHFSSPEFQH
ncbi:hypothetical protein CASFOL_029164 [Castilleja foliolosa]|uniref:Transposase n=1 Tax=Castilleja foliolosa TaxID=1961234 RepID=A0ABD3CD20_9LAMI